MTNGLAQGRFEAGGVSMSRMAGGGQVALLLLGLPAGPVSPATATQMTAPEGAEPSHAASARP